MRRAWIVPALLLLASCGGETAPETDQTPAVRGVSDSEIIIGSHNDLSGPAALLGVNMTNGARMRFEEENEAGGIHGRSVRFIVEDSQYQVPRAIQAANKLLNRDKIFLMFIAIGTPTNNAIMPMQFEQNVPNIFPATGARSMIEPFRREQFVLQGIYYQQIQEGTRHFIAEGATTPCVIYQDTDFGQETLDGVVDQLNGMGMEPAAISAHKPAETEFTSAVIRLRSAGCDLIAMGTIHKDTILILEAARKLGWTSAQWFGTQAIFIDSVAQMESGASEGLATFAQFPPVHRDDPANSATVNAIWDRFEERFGVSPDFAALEGYRAADVLIEALHRAGQNLNVDSLVAALESLASYEDDFGLVTTFGPNDHYGVTRSFMITVEDGRWQNSGTYFDY